MWTSRRVEKTPAVHNLERDSCEFYLQEPYQVHTVKVGRKSLALGCGVGLGVGRRSSHFGMRPEHSVLVNEACPGDYFILV